MCNETTDGCPYIHPNETWVYDADTGTFETYKELPFPTGHNFCFAKLGPNSILIYRGTTDYGGYLFDIDTEEFTEIELPTPRPIGMCMCSAQKMEVKRQGLCPQNEQFYICPNPFKVL